MVFSFDEAQGIIQAGDREIPLILVGQHRDPWFRANDVAAFLGYTQPSVAISKHIKPGKNKKTLRELLPDVITEMERLASEDKKQFWLSEPGLYRMVGHSHLPAAEAFQDWIYEEVLPAIRKTGQYSIDTGANEQPEQPSDIDLWNQKRLDGIELFKLKNASVKKLLACCVGGASWCNKYKIINGAINRAILDYNCSKKAFLMDNGLPQTVTIPEMLAFDGQLLRSMMERRYHTHIMENWEQLQKMTDREMECCFNAIGQQMQAANKAGGYTVPKEKLLSMGEVKSRKRGLAAARKQGLLPSADVKALSHAGSGKKQRTLIGFVEQ